MIVAGLGLLAAVASCLVRTRAISKTEQIAVWKERVPLLSATGTGLWRQPLAVYAILCNVGAVIANLRIDDAVSSIPGLVQVSLTLAMASCAFLLSTPTLRSKASYLTGIALAYAASLAVTALALEHRAGIDQPMLAHLLIAAGLSLIGCCGAVIYSWAINGRIRSVDQDCRGSLLVNREFYAGLLHHFVFSASCLVLIGLVHAVVIVGIANTSSAWMILWICIPLAATFSLSAPSITLAFRPTAHSPHSALLSTVLSRCWFLMPIA